MRTREETPDPDLKAMHLLSKAAPCSPKVSLADPAPGKVRDTVEVEAASSVTMVRPFGSAVTEAELAFPGLGEPAGTLKCHTKRKTVSSEVHELGKRAKPLKQHRQQIRVRAAGDEGSSILKNAIIPLTLDIPRQLLEVSIILFLRLCLRPDEGLQRGSGRLEGSSSWKANVCLERARYLCVDFNTISTWCRFSTSHRVSTFRSFSSVTKRVFLHRYLTFYIPDSSF